MAVLVLSAALAGGCGRGPTTPDGGAPAASSFEGVWSLEYFVADCTGYRNCFAFLNTKRTVTLRLAPGGAGFEGVVSIGLDNVDVSGSVAGSTLQLQGIRRPAIATDVEIEVTKLDLTDAGLLVTGAFEYTARGASNPSFSGNARMGGTITSAQLLAPSAATGWTGTWEGRVAVRDCSSIGWPDCYPHAQRDTYPFTLALAQQGSAVTGTLQVSGSTIVNVSGTASGNSVMLQGSGVEPNHAFDEVTTLRPSTLTRDKVGRLSGTIAFEVAWPPKLPSWTYKATDFRVVELLNVAAKPPS
jgi:hypothetical protein